MMSRKDKLGIACAMRKRIRRARGTSCLALWSKHWNWLVYCFGIDFAELEQERLENCTPFRYFELLGDTYELRMYYGKKIRFLSHKGVMYV